MFSPTPNLQLTSCHLLDEIRLKLRAALKEGPWRFTWVLIRMFWMFGCM